MKKHILVVASTFPSSDHDPVPAFVKDQIIAMKKADPELQFSVLAPHDKRSKTHSFTRHKYYNEYRFHYFWPHSLEKLAGRGIMPALKSNPLNYLLIPFLFFGEFLALLRLVIKLKPGILYAHWFTPQAIVSHWVGSITNTPFVFTTHAADVAVWHKIPFFGKIIVKQSVRKSTAFTAVSSRSMEKVAGFFTSDEWSELQKRSAIIPMGTTPPKIAAGMAPTKKDTRTVLFIGRLVEKKGVQYLIPAFAALLENHPSVQLVIAGDGPWLKRLQNQAKELLPAESYRFTGYVTGTAKQHLIESADIYAVPSIITEGGDAEGLPVSLMEGLSYGKICVTTNESGADDILKNGYDGFLVPHKDSAGMASALSRVLELDDTEISNLSQHAKETANQFDWNLVADRHIAWLRRHLTF